MLLGSGADPNLPLGEGVGTALCSLTTHAALKTRDGAASITMVSSTLLHIICCTVSVEYKLHFQHIICTCIFG